MTNQPLGCRGLSRLAITVVGGLGVLLLVAGPASAQTCYPPGSAACSTTTTTMADAVVVSDQTLAPGQSFTIRAAGFRAGATVTFTLDGVLLGTAVADDQGVATLTTDIPAGTAPGRHTIVASGLDPAGQVRSVEEAITVTGSRVTGTSNSGRVAATSNGGSGPSGSLARTGAYAASSTAAGVGLVGGGLLLRRAAKRRRTSPA